MNETTITDIRIPFWRLAGIILKFMLASIPAMIVVYSVFFLFSLGIMALSIGGLALPELFEQANEVEELKELREQMESGGEGSNPSSENTE